MEGNAFPLYVGEICKSGRSVARKETTYLMGETGVHESCMQDI